MAEMRKVLHERPQGGLPSNTILNPQEDIKVITTRNVLTESTTRVPPPVVQPSPASRSSELPFSPFTSSVIPERNPHQPLIPYPSRLHKEKLQDKSDIQIHSFLQMFKKLHFNITFPEALAYMPKYAKMVKDLLTNKEKLFELVNTPLNENCLVVLLKKLPEKLRDTGRFLIPCEFQELESCMALTDLGASINLMHLSVWEKLILLKLTLTRMILELATWTVAYPDGIDEDVLVKVGKYPRKHGDESIHMIDILDNTCGDYFHEVLNVQKSIHPLSGSPTPSSNPVVESLSPSLTPFGDSDFLLEETDVFLYQDDSIPPGIDNGIYDSEGNILFLEELLNDDPTPDLPPHLLMFEINETEKIKNFN
ncbi:reverse transcriptase domain-containing protein [Tanacetum coccineum]